MSRVEDSECYWWLRRRCRTALRRDGFLHAGEQRRVFEAVATALCGRLRRLVKSRVTPPTLSNKLRSDLVNYAVCAAAAEEGGAIDVARSVLGQASAGIESVGCAGKAVDDRIFAAGGFSRHNTATEGARRVDGSAVEGGGVAVAGSIEEAGGGLFSIVRLLAKSV